MKTYTKGNIDDKLESFSDHWNPRIIAELNGQQVKVAKLKGDFVWHSHADEDELFLVVKGELVIEFRDKKEVLRDGDFLVVPRGIEHRPIAQNEVEVVLFEPASTVNTGEIKSEMTKTDLEKI